MTAFELCGEYRDQRFMLKGGSVVWEAISYSEKADKCRISRLVKTGGKSFIMGLNYQMRYINPDTIINIINP